MRCGYVVLDDFLETRVTNQVAKLVEESLDTYPNFKNDGIEWRLPMPRNARSDVATWLVPSRRPASDAILSEHILPAFQRLLADLHVIFSLQGLVEQQLAWYPGDGAGYSRHTDAVPDDRVDSEHRKLTVILYCN